jgi:rhs-related protein
MCGTHASVFCFSDDLCCIAFNRSYTYDALGNLIYRQLPNGENQYHKYDLENQLVHTEIKKAANKPTTSTAIKSAYQPFRLQNLYADRETGLHYNPMRYYEPDAGQFVNQDPIGLLGGDNLYSFGNQVLDFIDPLGLKIYGHRKNGTFRKSLDRNPRRKARAKGTVSKIKKMVMLAKPYMKKIWMPNMELTVY